MLPKSAYLNGLAHIKEIGPKRFQLLHNYFQGDLSAVWNNFNRWPKGIIAEKKYSEVHHFINSFDLEKELLQLKQNKITLLDLEEEDYPNLLKEINDPPFALYCKGTPPPNHKSYITVVGTRKISNYGRDLCRHLISPLIHSGIGVISGLAFGVDSFTHQLSLNLGGYTSAVLGSGVNLITPRQHENLGKIIIHSGGSILSEFSPNRECEKGSFPRRNRILAGLSPITLIIEAAERSGALITARYALDYNREVGIVPGNIFSDTSKGCHKLAKQGSMIITQPEDLLSFFGIDENIPAITVQVTDTEMNIIKMLSATPTPLDVLIVKSSLNSSELLSLLTSLELKGAVKNNGGFGFKLMNTNIIELA